MLKHGVSHGGPYLFATVIAALIIRLAETLLPSALDWAEPFSDLIFLFGITIFDTEQVSAILLASILAFVWGMASKRHLAS